MYEFKQQQQHITVEIAFASSGINQWRYYFFLPLDKSSRRNVFANQDAYVVYTLTYNTLKDLMHAKLFTNTAHWFIAAVLSSSSYVVEVTGASYHGRCTLI